MTLWRKLLLGALPIAMLAVLWVWWAAMPRSSRDHESPKRNDGIQAHSGTHDPSPRHMDGNPQPEIVPSPDGERTVKGESIATVGAKIDYPSALATSIARYKAAIAKPGCPIGESRIARLETLHLAELRLLALVFPNDSQAAAERLIYDSTKSEQERYCGLYMLFVLAQETRGEARPALLVAASSADPFLSSRAVDFAAHLDDVTGFQGLLLKRAAEGSIDALYALAHSTDDQSISLLEQMASGSSNIALVAKEALEQRQTLQRSDWQSSLRRIISGEDADHSHWRLWAIASAKEHALPGLDAELRKRLDAAQAEYLDSFAARKASSSPEQPAYSASFEGRLINTSGIIEVEPLFDEILISLRSVGGKLSNVEMQRLRRLGYEGDLRGALVQRLSDQSGTR